MKIENLLNNHQVFEIKASHAFSSEAKEFGPNIGQKKKNALNKVYQRRKRRNILRIL